MITTGEIPSPRQGHSATLIGNKLYIIGGGSTTDFTSDVFILDLPRMR